MSTEKSLQAYIKNYSKQNHMISYKFSSPAQRGVPDLILITAAGKTIYIEVKSPSKRGRLSALQIHHINIIRSQGAEVYVIDSKEEAKRVIDQVASDAEAERGDYFHL